MKVELYGKGRCHVYLLIGLVGLLVIIFGLVNLIWPIRTLGVPGRKEAALVAVGGLVMFVAGVVMTPTKEASTPTASTKETKKEPIQQAATAPSDKKAEQVAEAKPAPEPTKQEPVKAEPKAFSFTFDEVQTRWRDPSRLLPDVASAGEYAIISWNRTDLADGTPRWMADEKLFLYEVSGSPKVQKVSMMSGFVADNANHNAEVMLRMAVMMQVVEPTSTVADRATIVDQLSKLAGNPDSPRTWTTGTTRWKITLSQPYVLFVAEPL